MTEHVLTAMSGGVDSTVAAALLVREGYRVTGATLDLFDKNAPHGQTDAALAARAAQSLGLPHLLIDARAPFRQFVMDAFARAYLAGDTPNPCVVCNATVKFGFLLDEALRLGMDKLATGHYAQIEYDEMSGRYLLKKAADDAKDQSYMLWSLSQQQLSHTLFPLGTLTKNDVRALAESFGLENAQKKDSQDICFVPDGDYAAFIETLTGKVSQPGDFVAADGTVLGRHKGLIRYTLGQRRGLGISADRPLYVTGKNPSDNTVRVGDEQELYATQMTVRDVNLIAVETLEQPVRADVKTRYSHTASPATVTVSGDIAHVEFDTPQRAVTSGQSAVFYQADTVLGGGFIADTQQ